VAQTAVKSPTPASAAPAQEPRLIARGPLPITSSRQHVGMGAPVPSGTMARTRDDAWHPPRAGRCNGTTRWRTGCAGLVGEQAIVTVQDLVDSYAVQEVQSHRLTVPPFGGLVTSWLSRAQRRDLPTF
jgi:hypothetical protein